MAQSKATTNIAGDEGRFAPIFLFQKLFYTWWKNRRRQDEWTFAWWLPLALQWFMKTYEGSLYRKVVHVWSVRCSEVSISRNSQLTRELPNVVGPISLLWSVTKVNFFFLPYSFQPAPHVTNTFSLFTIIYQTNGFNIHCLNSCENYSWIICS